VEQQGHGETETEGDAGESGRHLNRDDRRQAPDDPVPSVHRSSCPNPHGKYVTSPYSVSLARVYQKGVRSSILEEFVIVEWDHGITFGD